MQFLRRLPATVSCTLCPKIWRTNGHRHNPCGKNEEGTKLATDERRAELNYSSLKSIHCYQNKALKRHQSGSVCKETWQLTQGLTKGTTNQPPVKCKVQKCKTRKEEEHRIQQVGQSHVLFAIKKFIGFLKFGVL